MYQTRAKATKKLPIPRKGTKYIARSFESLENSIPVVIAIRDVLKLAKTSKEVKKMINKKLLKINGKEVKELREGIRLFNILEAGKSYELSLTNNGKFTFNETKNKNQRLVKVTNKKILKSKTTQINLYDGSNVITKDKINVHDSLILDFSGKITKHIPLEKGKDCLIISGKNIGKAGKIVSTKDSKVTVKIKDEDHTLDKGRIFAKWTNKQKQ